MELSQDTTPTTISMVHNTLTRMFNQNHIDKDTLAYLDPLKYECTCPTMYFLPKIHKQPPTGQPFVGRPIISGCSSPTAKISEYIDYFLLPIVTAQPTYVRDTADILRKLEEKTFPVSTQCSDNKHRCCCHVHKCIHQEKPFKAYAELSIFRITPTVSLNHPPTTSENCWN